MYKKVLSVILGAALMAGTLAGCGNSGKEAAATTAAAAETAKTEAAAPVSFDGTWPSTAVTLVVPAGADICGKQCDWCRRFQWNQPGA